MAGLSSLIPEVSGRSERVLATRQNREKQATERKDIDGRRHSRRLVLFRCQPAFLVIDVAARPAVVRPRPEPEIGQLDGDDFLAVQRLTEEHVRWFDGSMNDG